MAFIVYLIVLAEHSSLEILKKGNIKASTEGNEVGIAKVTEYRWRQTYVIHKWKLIHRCNEWYNVGNIRVNVFFITFANGRATSVTGLICNKPKAKITDTQSSHQDFFAGIKTRILCGRSQDQNILVIKMYLLLAIAMYWYEKKMSKSSLFKQLTAFSTDFPVQ